MKHKPRKRFGQNFLHSQSIIFQILQSINPQKDQTLLEIGPGLGALTIPLLKAAQHLYAVEIDTDLQLHLDNLLSHNHSFTLVKADALTVDYSQFGPHLRVVGNLPYNISTPLLIHLLTFLPFITDMHFMLQKEVVLRMASEPGTKAYGRLSVMLQYFCHVEHLFDVPSDAFDPAPKVESAIVRLTPHATPIYEAVAAEKLQAIVAQSFGMRRKTLTNNLKGIISAEQLDALKIDGKKRPEQITVEEYVRLAKFSSNEV
jgi:16S rRNA (adenine1518-N6/adenine1519-N6)-dimethyltransferase